MEKNKKIIKLCYLQIAFYVVFLTSLFLHFKRGLDHRAFALLIILTLLGCASALTLTDYLKSLIRRSGFDVAGVHDKKSLEEKLLQLQNADDTLDVGVMMFDMNNLKIINDTYGHEEGDVFIQTFASYLTRILTEDSFLARFGGDEFVIVQNHATWNQLEQMNLQLQTMIDTYNQTADHPLSYAVGYELSCKNHYYLIMDLLQMADEKMYQDKRYKKQLQKNGPLAARRSMLAESISTDSLKEKIFTLLNNRSEEKQYAFLMTDVDNFHLINDYWGYEMGTNILNFILKKLELFPQTLFVNRYHSDIFVGIIDITGQDPAVVREKISAYHKQAIREVLESYPLNYMTLNTGVYYLNDTDTPAEEVISHANISPIRRYPDLQIHRIIKDDLRGRLDKGGRIGKYSSILQHVAEQSSAMEQRAAEAEREAVKLKKAEYMLEHVGEEYDGVISGVTGWGFYVELPNTVEGLVHIMTLKDDYYNFDEENYRLVGEQHGRVFRLGEPVRVRVRNAEPANRTIDFTYVEKETETE